MASQFIGERYVPQHEGEWDTSLPYDRLSIVTVTTGDNVDAYISRVPVPVGTPITDNNYWALLYISRITSGGSASVSWVDIENKPDTFPPSAHTQDWDTITGKPNTFPPTAHNQAISTIQGLQTTLNDLQDQINSSGGGGGPELVTGNIGSNGTYLLRTWSDGYKEYDIHFPFENYTASAQSGVYRTASVNIREAYPVPFDYQPILIYSASTNGNFCWAGAGASSYTTSPTMGPLTHLPYIYVYDTSGGQKTGFVSVHVRGH